MGYRLLAVLAHPDDESFGPGGTLALYAQRGVAVHLVCATRGEVGGAPPNMLETYGSVAQLREAELRCAAQQLGLAGVHILGYRDSGMAGSPDNLHPEALAAAPLQEVAGRVADFIRKIRPQVVITFDPVGGYFHPDHIAIHRATVEAIRAAGDPGRFPDGPPPYQPQKLYFHTFNRRFLRVVVRVLPLMGRDPRRWGRNGDIDLVEVASQEMPIHARINIAPAAGAKRKASACHASQGGPPTSGLMGLLFRLAGSRETFTRALPPARPRLREHDLFEGIPPED